MTKEAAIATLAAASGRYAVVCPPFQDRDGTSWTHPEGASCATTTGIVCAAAQSAGSVVILRAGVPAAVYRWDTGPDGATTCIIEPPTEGRVRLRVVDEEMVPRAGVYVTDLIGFATTGAEGEATLSIVGTGTHWVIASSDDGAVSLPVGVVAGGTATLVLGEPPSDVDPGEVLAEVRMSRLLEAVGDLEAVLESSPSPEVAQELGELLDTQLRTLDIFCDTSDVPTCRSWRSR